MTDHYLQDTTSTPYREGGLRLWHTTDRWNTPLGKPNGGYILASMLRAVTDELDVGRPLVTNLTYLASPEPDVDALISVGAVKLGRRIQTATAEAWQRGDDARRVWGHLTATFTRDHAGISHELGGPPDLPAPNDCVDPLTMGMAAEGLFGRIEYRFAQPPGWASGAPNGDPTVEMWQRLAGGREIDWPALGQLVDSAPPPVLELGAHVSMTVELTVHYHRLPRPGSWVASRFTTRHVVDGFHEEDGELWDEEGNLLAQSRQLAILLG